MRLEEDDDVEQFLTTFERLETVYKSPKHEWAIRLIQLLTCKARSAFVAMDPAHSTNYDRRKEAVLNKYELCRDICW